MQTPLVCSAVYPGLTIINTFHSCRDGLTGPPAVPKTRISKTENNIANPSKPIESAKLQKSVNRAESRSVKLLEQLDSLHENTKVDGLQQASRRLKPDLNGEASTVFTDSTKPRRKRLPPPNFDNFEFSDIGESKPLAKPIFRHPSSTNDEDDLPDISDLLTRSSKTNPPPKPRAILASSSTNYSDADMDDLVRAAKTPSLSPPKHQNKKRVVETSRLQPRSLPRSPLKRKADDIQNTPVKQKPRIQKPIDSPFGREPELDTRSPLSTADYQPFEEQPLFFPERTFHDSASIVNAEDSLEQNNSESGRGYEDFTLDESLFDIIPSNESFSDAEISRPTLINTESSLLVPSTLRTLTTSQNGLQPSQTPLPSYHTVKTFAPFAGPSARGQPSLMTHMLQKPQQDLSTIFRPSTATAPIPSSSQTIVSRKEEPPATINSELAKPPPTEVELRAERIKKELRWRGDEAGWRIVGPDAGVQWDERLREVLRVYHSTKEDEWEFASASTSS